MARIRSTHPGQWTDEDFVTLSSFARLLCLAIRNEADDYGCFEWKPVRIKMRLLPMDNVDIEELLAELVNGNHVMSYEIKGRKYGVIRNFCLFQKPKKPNSFCPNTPEVLEYAGLNLDEDETSSEPVPNQSGKSSAEGRKGGREEGKEEKASPKSSAEKRGSRIPDDWLPSEPGQQYAASLGMTPQEIRHERDKFYDFWIAKPGRDGRKLDWDATWRNWIRRSVDNRTNHGTRRPRANQSGLDGVLEAAAEYHSSYHS